MRLSFEMTERQELIIWVYTLRQLKNLKRFGYIHYVSNRLKYVVMYVDQSEAEEKMQRIQHLHFVRKVELSPRSSIDMTFAEALKHQSDETNLLEQTS